MPAKFWVQRLLSSAAHHDDTTADEDTALLAATNAIVAPARLEGLSVEAHMAQTKSALASMERKQATLRNEIERLQLALRDTEVVIASTNARLAVLVDALPPAEEVPAEDATEWPEVNNPGRLHPPVVYDSEADSNVREANNTQEGLADRLATALADPAVSVVADPVVKPRVVAPRLPTNVYWDSEQGTFRGRHSLTDKGADFYERWHEFRADFPTEPHANPDVYLKPDSRLVPGDGQTSA